MAPLLVVQRAVDLIESVKLPMKWTALYPVWHFKAAPNVTPAALRSGSISLSMDRFCYIIEYLFFLQKSSNDAPNRSITAALLLILKPSEVLTYLLPDVPAVLRRGDFAARRRETVVLCDCSSSAPKATAVAISSPVRKRTCGVPKTHGLSLHSALPHRHEWCFSHQF